MDQMIYLLDSNNIVIAKAIFVRPVKPLPNGKTSISLVIKEIMNKSEIKDTVFFIFKEDLSEQNDQKTLVANGAMQADKNNLFIPEMIREAEPLLFFCQ